MRTRRVRAAAARRVAVRALSGGGNDLAGLMPVPSTLHNPLHTLNCTAFAIASAVDNIVPKGAGPRAV